MQPEHDRHGQRLRNRTATRGCRLPTGRAGHGVEYQRIQFRTDALLDLHLAHASAFVHDETDLHRAGMVAVGRRDDLPGQPLAESGHFLPLEAGHRVRVGQQERYLPIHGIPAEDGDFRQFLRHFERDDDGVRTVFRELDRTDPVRIDPGVFFAADLPLLSPGRLQDQARSCRVSVRQTSGGR